MLTLLGCKDEDAGINAPCSGYNEIMKRRRILQGLLALPILGSLNSVASAQPKPTLNPLLNRTIPKSGQKIPVIGLGTYQAFGSLGDAEQQRRLTEVLQLFGQSGGNFIDTSPMYSEAESVLGKLLPRATPPKNLDWFLATKVWIDGQQAGISQMKSSRRKMGSTKLDLIQIHNLRDWKIHLSTLKKMKTSQQIRYIGATTWGGLQHAELERVMKTGALDFIQVSYNLLNRKIEQRLLPLAKDLGIGVIVNRPFGQGGLFSRVKNREVPEWVTRELDCHSWAQVFLKFTLADERVTVVIPATSKPKHLIDNMRAGQGPMFSRKQRDRLAALFS